MIEFIKHFVSLQFHLFDCMLNIVPIASIGVEAAIKRREEKIFAFLKIKQNLEAYLQEFIFSKNEIRTFFTGIYNTCHHCPHCSVHLSIYGVSSTYIVLQLLWNNHSAF